jgi:hypothetical protein
MRMAHAGCAHGQLVLVATCTCGFVTACQKASPLPVTCEIYPSLPNAGCFTVCLVAQSSSKPAACATLEAAASNSVAQCDHSEMAAAIHPWHSDVDPRACKSWLPHRAGGWQHAASCATHPGLGQIPLGGGAGWMVT